MNLRLLAASRSLMFNYGQSLWSPYDRYKDLCRILGVSSALDPIPNYKPLAYPFSFASKAYHTPHYGEFHLYHTGSEALQFLDLAPAIKLNWLRNFTKAQELLFSFNESELDIIFREIIQPWGNPNHDNRLPYEISSV